MECPTIKRTATIISRTCIMVRRSRSIITTTMLLNNRSIWLRSRYRLTMIAAIMIRVKVYIINLINMLSTTTIPPHQYPPSPTLSPALTPQQCNRSRWADRCSRTLWHIRQLASEVIWAVKLAVARGRVTVAERKGKVVVAAKAAAWPMAD